MNLIRLSYLAALAFAGSISTMTEDIRPAATASLTPGTPSPRPVASGFQLPIGLEEAATLVRDRQSLGCTLICRIGPCLLDEVIHHSIAVRLAKGAEEFSIRSARGSQV